MLALVGFRVIRYSSSEHVVLPHLLSLLTSESARARGFSPEPQLGALLTGLLDLIASDAQAPDALCNLAAADVAELIGDACVVCLLADAGRALQPVAVADSDEAGALLLRPLVAGSSHFYEG